MTALFTKVRYTTARVRSQKKSIDIIKRQQAEIERLKAEHDALIRNYKECAMEAVRDFAERLKEKAYRPCEWWPILHAVDAKDIDEIVAEMEGEDGRA